MFSCGRQRGGAVAAKAEYLKSAKYAAFKVSHHIVPFAMETSGVLDQAALSLIWDIGQRGEEHSKEYLLQIIAIAVQRGNAAAVLGTVGRWEDLWRSMPKTLYLAYTCKREWMNGIVRFVSARPTQKDHVT